MKSKPQTKLKAVPAKPPAVDVDAETAAAERRALEANAAQIKVNDAIDLIIGEVDRLWPSALPAENWQPTEWVTDNCNEIEELFRTAESRDNEYLLSEIVYKVMAANPHGNGVDRLESAIIHFKYSLERFHLAVGFAAGLRATGMSKPAARLTMLGFLRNYDMPAAERSGHEGRE